jgi:hypothetical protein
MRLTIVLCLLFALWPLAGAASPQGLFSSPLHGSAPPLRSIQKRFQQVQMIKLHFKQEKHLQETERVLVSRGVLTVAPKLGVDWHVLKPFESEWTVTRDGRVLRGPKSGATTAVANLLMGLFSADIEQLKSLFHVYWQKQSAGWWLGLKPKKARLKKAIDSIAVAGSEYVKRVEVNEASGDHTVIQFTGRKTQDLTPAIRKLFDSE